MPIGTYCQTAFQKGFTLTSVARTTLGFSGLARIYGVLLCFNYKIPLANTPSRRQDASLPKFTFTILLKARKQNHSTLVLSFFLCDCRGAVYYLRSRVGWQAKGWFCSSRVSLLRALHTLSRHLTDRCVSSSLTLFQK